MYIPKRRALKQQVKITTHKDKHTETVLMDSSAAKNFMSHQTVKKLQLGTLKLPQ